MMEIKNQFEIKWLSVDNEYGTASLKEHGYIKVKRLKPYTGEEYDGNSQLCNRYRHCSNDGESSMFFDEIDFFKKEPSESACKKCLKIYKNKILPLTP